MNISTVGDKPTLSSGSVWGVIVAFLPPVLKALADVLTALGITVNVPAALAPIGVLVSALGALFAAIRFRGKLGDLSATLRKNGGDVA
jgi:ABC-type long-subunit fatty acid transport system fused permease/ATPase subunit